MGPSCLKADRKHICNLTQASLKLKMSLSWTVIRIYDINELHILAFCSIVWWSRSTRLSCPRHIRLFSKHVNNILPWENRACRPLLNSHMAYLMSELIAGHTQNNESLGGVPTVKLAHLSVVPGCCSSKRRHILNEHNFPLQRRETEAFSRQQLGCQVVKPSHIPSHSL